MPRVVSGYRAASLRSSRGVESTTHAARRETLRASRPTTAGRFAQVRRGNQNSCSRCRGGTPSVASVGRTGSCQPHRPCSHDGAWPSNGGFHV